MVCLDQAGIVAGLSGFCASRGIDIAEVSTRCYPAAHTGAQMFAVQMIINVSAGKPGSKEWVQYAATPFDIPMISGTVGVQAPSLYPYIPEQLDGVLGAIKAAAEYEQTLIEAYPKFKDNPNAQDGVRRMGPQLVAHILMIALIVAGNIIYFVGKKRGAAQ